MNMRHIVTLRAGAIVVRSLSQGWGEGASPNPDPTLTSTQADRLFKDGVKRMATCDTTT